MTYQECLDAVAKEKGFKDWNHISFGNLILTEICQEAATMFAEQSRWVSVKDTLPEYNKNVLAILNGQVAIMSYCQFKEDGMDKEKWGFVYDGLYDDAIIDDNYYPTHWTNIPSPPKQDK